MFWSTIKQEALARGELVYAMNQDLPNFDESRMPPDWVAAGASGRCVGFALRWIALRAWGKDYHHTVTTKFRVTGPVANGGFAEVPRDHALSRSITAGFLLRVETVLRQYEVPVNRTRYVRIPYAITARFVLDRVFAGDGLYYFELRRDGGAHAIAVQRMGNCYRLFDANEGHFVVNGQQRFAAFIEWFLKESGYAERYLIGTWMAGVTAIPPYPTYRPGPPLRHSTPGLRQDPHNGPWTHQWGKPAEVDLLGRRAVR